MSYEPAEITYNVVKRIGETREPYLVIVNSILPIPSSRTAAFDFTAGRNVLKGVVSVLYIQPIILLIVCICGVFVFVTGVPACCTD